MFLFILLATFFICSIIVVWAFVSQKRLGMETVVALTGAPGSGKSKTGVTKSVKAYRKRLWLWKLGLLGKVPKPLFYSNIPILYKEPICFGLFRRPKWAVTLTYEHLTLQDRLVEYSVIFIDELGQFADQYAYDNPFVMQYLQKFIRFIRHYIDGYLVVTDQSSSNIVVAIRRRINTIYNLSKFRRFMIFWYKVNVDEVVITEDMMTVKDSDKATQEQQYFMGHLHFKWLKMIDISRLFMMKHYDSRCYLPLFDDVKYTMQDRRWAEYKTKYLIDLPNNTEMRKQFKRDGFIPAEDMLKYVNEWKTQTKGEDNGAEKNMDRP
jgi:predicted pyridoxine 5'-phosphate oxidase superfamily flavin-nucleotide-binding protein